jgi:hypothetical protein
VARHTPLLNFYKGDSRMPSRRQVSAGNPVTEKPIVQFARVCASVD